MPITITINGEDAKHALRELGEFAEGLIQVKSGEYRRPSVSPTQTFPVGYVGEPETSVELEAVLEGIRTGTLAPRNDDTSATARQRGQPSPGKARRTKAEIAEDEAAETADTSRVTEVTHAISSGDERISPDDEQDAADEAREAAANKTGDALTHEDLRKALAEFSKKHGMKAAVAAVKEGGVIGCTVDQVPVERIADVISDLFNHSVTNTPRAGEEADPRREEAPAMPTYPATKDGLMKAMLDYALKYDGTNDIKQASMATMPATMTDAPAIFKLRFGEAVNALSKVPEDGYAQAIADVQEATVKNPFNREVK